VGRRTPDHDQLDRAGCARRSLRTQRRTRSHVVGNFRALRGFQGTADRGPGPLATNSGTARRAPASSSLPPPVLVDAVAPGILNENGQTC
jgi:hypothetical protein